MANVKIKVTLRDGEACQIVIKIGSNTLDFQNSQTKTAELDPKRYTAVIGGFLDPAGTAPTVTIEFFQGQSLLNSITITDQSFIKTLRVTVK